MAAKEAKARIKINKLLAEVGWHFLDDAQGSASIVLEPNVKTTESQFDSLGHNIEKVDRGNLGDQTLKGEAETGERSVNVRPAERASHGWRAPGFRAVREARAMEVLVTGPFLNPQEIVMFTRAVKVSAFVELSPRELVGKIGVTTE
jgi:hypothetical protein